MLFAVVPVSGMANDCEEQIHMDCGTVANAYGCGYLQCEADWVYYASTYTYAAVDFFCESGSADTAIAGGVFASTPAAVGWDQWSAGTTVVCSRIKPCYCDETDYWLMAGCSSTGAGTIGQQYADRNPVPGSECDIYGGGGYYY